MLLLLLHYHHQCATDHKVLAFYISGPGYSSMGHYGAYPGLGKFCPWPGSVDSRICPAAFWERRL